MNKGKPIATRTHAATRVGAMLRAGRLRKEWTQGYVADTLNVRITYINQMESGQKVGSMPTLHRLCMLLDLDHESMGASYALDERDRAFVRWHKGELEHGSEGALRAGVSGQGQVRKQARGCG